MITIIEAENHDQPFYSLLPCTTYVNDRLHEKVLFETLQKKVTMAQLSSLVSVNDLNGTLDAAVWWQK